MPTSDMAGRFGQSSTGDQLQQKPDTSEIVKVLRIMSQAVGIVVAIDKDRSSHVTVAG